MHQYQIILSQERSGIALGVEAGATSVTIDSALVDPSGRVSVGQSTGATATFTTVPDLGSLRVEFETPLSDSAAFRCEIASCRNHPTTASYLALAC